MTKLTNDELEAFEYHGVSSGTDTPPLVRNTIIKAVAELRELRKENADLRTAVIHVCTVYNSHYDERKAVRELRERANLLGKPFTLDGL